MKKAQVTMFVLIGIIILVAIFGAIFLVNQLRGGDVAETENVPLKFQPIATIVESCIRKTTLDAVRAMGAHGGYIDPLNMALTPNKLTYSTDAARSELVAVSTSKDSLVPYYVHVPGKASGSHYEYESAAPSLDNMEFQIESYIFYNLPLCIDVSELQATGVDAVFEDANISSIVTIKDEQIDVYVTYPVTLTSESDEAKISKFNTVINFPLKKYYEMALSVAAAELETQFAESYTTSLISYYSGVDFDKLPPVLSVDNKPYIITWSQAKVNGDLNSLLVSYTPAIQVTNTSSYIPVSGNTVEDAFLRSLSVELFNSAIPNTGINFFYKDKSLTSNVRPGTAVIRPGIEVEEGTKNTPASRTNTYRFFYDVSYPMLVEIRGLEKDSSISEYSFVFAMEVNLIENKPPLAWQLGYGTVDWDESYLEVTHSYSGLDQSGSDVVVNSPQSSKNFFCDEETWISGKHTLTVKDDHNTFIDDANILFKCADFAECYMASTVNGRAEFTLPLCEGGYLSVSKDGYESKAMQLSTYDSVDANLGTITLAEAKSLLASVKIAPINKAYTRDVDWEWHEGISSLNAFQDIDASYEQVLLTIVQVASPGTSPMAASIVFGKDEENTNISLVPGEYEVSAILVDYNGVVIPKECSRVCSDRGFLGIGCSEYEYYPEEDVELSPASWGGIELNKDSATTFSISRQDLDAASSIEFKVLRIPDLSLSTPAGACIDALEEIGKLEEYSALYASQVMPELK
jgi:hypothetical protein